MTAPGTAVAGTPGGEAADFGGYRRGAVLREAPGATVSVAVAAGGAEGWVLKEHHPAPSPRLSRFLGVEAWLVAAELQQAAARDGECVVDVAAWGRTPTGGYVVLRRQAWSLERLVPLLAPRAPVLRALSRRWLELLAGWEAAFGGPHGNLKPSNVFVRGEGALGGRAFVASDPWHLPGVPVAERRRRDLAALGQVIVELVRSRGAGGWPVADGPEWRALGRTGGAWREFANLLLAPPDPGEPPTAEKAAAVLAAIPVEVPTVRKLALGAAAALVVGTAAVAAYARFGDGPSLPRSLVPLADWLGNPTVRLADLPLEWRLLVRAWEEGGRQMVESAAAWSGQDSLWPAQTDPLRAAVAALAEAGEGGLSPRRIVPAAQGIALEQLADNPPPAVRTAVLRRDVAEEVVTAWSLISAADGALAEWPRWEELNRMAMALEGRGWTGAADDLSRRVLPRTDGAVPVRMARVEALRRLAAEAGAEDLTALEGRWREVQDLVAALADPPTDPVQRAIPEVVLGSVQDPGTVGAAASALAEAKAVLADARAAASDPAVDHVRFLAEAEVLRVPGPVDAGRVEAWKAALAEHRRVTPAEDPRASSLELEALDALAARARELDVEAPPEPGDLTVPGFQRAWDALRGPAERRAAMEVLRKDVPALRAELEVAAAGRVELERGLEGTLARQSPTRWRERLAPRAAGLPAVAERWERWRQQVEPAAVLEADRALFRTRRSEGRRLAAWLDALEGPPGLGAVRVPETASYGADLAAPLAAWSAAVRVRAAAAAVDAVSAVPEGDFASTVAAVPVLARALEEHRRTQARLPALAADLARLGELLGSGASWEEGVADVAARLERVPEVAALGGAPAVWRAAAARLGAVAASTDRPSLVAAAQEPALSVALTAWRRLGGLGDWPADAVETLREAGIGKGLRALLEGGGVAEERRGRLIRELDRVQAERWEAAAKRVVAAGPTPYLEFLDVLTESGVPEGQLAPDLAFDRRLRVLREELDPGMELGELARRRDAFVAAARSNPALAARPEVMTFLRALQELELAESGGRRPAGPETRGWELVAGTDERRLDYVWAAPWRDGGQTVRLEFQLVEPPGKAPFFLSRRAIAVGDFITLVSLRPEGEAVLAQFPRWVRDERADPGLLAGAPLPWRPLHAGRGWRASAQWRLQLGDGWVFNPPPELRQSEARQGLLPAPLEQQALEVPVARSPMTQVPPAAARIFVEQVLGARLPEPDEWRAAMEVLAPGAAEVQGNFRDRRYAALWSTLADGGSTWRPNRTIFLPFQDDGGRRRPFADVDGRARSTADDGRIWPGPVDDGPVTGGFLGLFGNVWTLLAEEGGGGARFFVAGGSALSPVDLDPRQVYPVEAARVIGGAGTLPGFADVGLRPALDTSPGRRARSLFLQLVRRQGFLRT